VFTNLPGNDAAGNRCVGKKNKKLSRAAGKIKAGA
jgi:hypothetical protein